MSFFSDIVESILLTEGVPVGKVNDAIDRTYEVEINYRTDGKDNATGKRIIQPVAYGLTKAGNPVIRAFQPYGDTTSKIPSWKFFRLDRIIGWKPKFKQKFTEAPPGMHNAEGNFNPNGDKTMSVVYNIAQFGNKKQRPNTQVADNGGPVEKEKLKKLAKKIKPNTFSVLAYDFLDEKYPIKFIDKIVTDLTVFGFGAIESLRDFYDKAFELKVKQLVVLMPKNYDVNRFIYSKFDIVAEVNAEKYNAYSLKIK